MKRDRVRRGEVDGNAEQRKRRDDGRLELAEKPRRELHRDAEDQNALQQQRADETRPEYRTP